MRAALCILKGSAIRISTSISYVVANAYFNGHTEKSLL